VNWKDWLFFIIIMMIGMWLGDAVLQYIPGIDNPYLASFIGAVVTLTPGYWAYHKFRRKIE